ncbi:Major intrinsic protein [Dillenia turbinata]|uniref:Major intrinsic protein n=1 Tax=Dillenia turbinata TaxID=194707 RepID=A0AAN8V4H9_9MAGN
MSRITLGNKKEILQKDFFKSLLVEFICTFLYEFVGVGATMAAETLDGSSLANLFFVGMAHALVVAVMVSSSLHISGGHINPAVTLSLAVGGHCTVLRSFLYWVDQLLASTLACYSLRYMTGGRRIPINQLASGVGCMQGLLMEHILTFSLLFTVYATMVDPKRGVLDGSGPLLTGLLVGANIFAGGAFSGASMNPARSFGPALASGDWTNHWIYWLGPLTGGGLAGFVYENFFMPRIPQISIPYDEESGQFYIAN